VIDLGHATTKIVVARGRQVLLVKSMDVGGRNFDAAVAKQLDLSEKEASELRLQIMREGPGSSADDGDAAGADEAAEGPGSVGWTLLDAVRGEVEDLAREIALCLRYCSVTFRGLRPEQVTMTGGQAYDPMMTRLLGEQLGIQCQVGQPLKGVVTSEVDFGEDRRGTLAEWGVCAGLALRCAGADAGAQRGNDEPDRLSA
jgi:type IV pilus assembly protein PilM